MLPTFFSLIYPTNFGRGGDGGIGGSPYGRICTTCSRAYGVSHANNTFVQNGAQAGKDV